MVVYGNDYYLMKLYNRLPKDVKGHSVRVSVLMQIITNGYIDLHVEKTGRFTEANRNELVQFAREAGSYHDIGKVSVRQELLITKKKFTAAEYEEVKKHTIYAEDLLDQCLVNLATAEQRYYGEVKEVCVAHHERWDGNGYPYGLAGTAIPVFARICAVADAYDAITSCRPYSKRFSHTQAVHEIKRCSGTQFDPDVVKAFLSKSAEINQLLSNKKKN